MASSWAEVEAGSRTVRVSSPDKVLYPEAGVTKLELAQYVVAVGDGFLRGLRERPTVLHRFPRGVDREGFFQKRVNQRPDWVPAVHVVFPAGGSADELCPDDVSHLVWAVNLGTIEFHPWAVRRSDLLRPDEMRLDLDPAPGVPFSTVRAVAATVREVLGEVGMVGHPKTSGKRGVHVHVRIEPRWGFLPVRRAVLAFAREIERRLPDQATAAWWKEERGERVLIDFNQNLPDRTVLSAFSMRPTPEATVSCPVTWDDLASDLDPRDLTVRTVPGLTAERGDPSAAIDDEAFSIEPLLEWVERDEANGQGEAPFPPMFPKVPGEPKRIDPARARRSAE